MTEVDWDMALEVFRACLPAQCAKARDDRLFLEALHHFTVHNISWGALPERFGPRNFGLETRRSPEQGGRLRSRFARIAREGFAMLAGLSGTAHLVQMFD